MKGEEEDDRGMEGSEGVEVCSRLADASERVT